MLGHALLTAALSQDNRTPKKDCSRVFAYSGDVGLVELLLCGRASPSKTYQSGTGYSLQIATRKECVRIVELLAEIDGDMHLTDKRGRSALN